MNTVETLLADVAAIKAAAVKEKEETKAELQAHLQPLKDKVAELADQVAKGGVATQAELDALHAGLVEALQTVSDITVPSAPPEMAPIP